MKEMYYVIGFETVQEMTKEVLLERIEEDYYGNGTQYQENALEGDPNYWGESIMVIKGNIVVPKPVETVTKYEV